MLLAVSTNQIPQRQVGNERPGHGLVSEGGGDGLPLLEARLDPLLDRRPLVGVPVHGDDGGEYDAERDGARTPSGSPLR